MIVSIVAGYFFLEETHPDMQPWSTSKDLEETSAETPLMPAQAGTTTAAANLNHESYGTFNAVSEENEEEWRVRPNGRPASIGSAEKTKVFSRRVVMLTIALGIFTYHSMTYDHLLPIFFQDERVFSVGEESFSILTNENGSLAGGLGLSIQDVGVIMSFNGIIALVVQAVIFPLVASWLGVWKSFLVVTILHPIAYFVVPFLAEVPESSLYPAIYACLTIRNLLSIIAYPVLLILIKEASPSPSCLGKINGLAASTGAACRTIASPVAGLLYGIGIKIDFTALAWWASALVAIIGAFQAFFINQRKKGPKHQVHSAAFAPGNGLQHKQSIVHIRVQDREDSAYYSEEERGGDDEERTPLRIAEV